MKKKILAILLTAMLLANGTVYAIEPVPGFSEDEGQTDVDEMTYSLPETLEEPEESEESQSPIQEETTDIQPEDDMPGEYIEEPTEEIPTIEITNPAEPIDPEPLPELPEEAPTIGFSEPSEDPSPKEFQKDFVVGYSKEESVTFDPSNIVCNSSISGMIDPYNIQGKGQLLFEDITITNNDSVPINVVMDHFNMEQVGGIQLIREKPTEEIQDKWMMITLSSGMKETDFLTSENNSFDFGTLLPGETLTLTLNGEVNGCSHGWAADDCINLSFHFEFSPLENAAN